MIKEVNNYVRIRNIRYATDHDVSYQDERYFNLYYEVEGIGDIGELEGVYTKGYKLREFVKVGDKILVQWYAISAAYERGSDKHGNYFIEYRDIIAVEREVGYVPINDNVFVEMDSTSRTSVGKVVGVSTDIDYYIGYDGEEYSPTRIPLDSYVLANAIDMREVEHLFLQKMSKKIYSIQSKDILLISDSPITVDREYSEQSHSYVFKG